MQRAGDGEVLGRGVIRWRSSFAFRGSRSQMGEGRRADGQLLWDGLRLQAARGTG